MLKSAILALLVLAFSSSCAKDIDIDDWNRQKLEEDLVRTQAIAGSYSGKIYSERIDGGVANLSVTIEPDLAIGPGQHRNSERSAIRVTLHYFAGSEVSIVFHEGSYDSVRGTFLAKTPIQPRKGQNVVLKINGRIQEQQMNGELSFEGSGSVVPFELTKNQEISLPKAVRPSEESIKVEKFVSDKSFGDPKRSLPVELWIMHTPLGAQESFSYIFVPRKRVQAVLHFGYKDQTKPLQFVFEDVELDLQSGSLDASRSLIARAPNPTLALTCRRISSTSGKSGWKCLYVSNISNWVQTISFYEN